MANATNRHLAWVNTNINVIAIPDNSSTGKVLENDLEYRHHLHEKHDALNIRFSLDPQPINPYCVRSKFSRPNDEGPTDIYERGDKMIYRLHLLNRTFL